VEPRLDLLSRESVLCVEAFRPAFVREGAHDIAQPTPPESDARSGTYRCTNCGYEVDVPFLRPLPLCAECSGPTMWEVVIGGDCARDLHPDAVRADSPSGDKRSWLTHVWGLFLS